MSADRIAEIRARLAAATPGPWREEHPGSGGWIVGRRPPPKSDVCRSAAGADAALIAAAPADLEYLLAIVDAADALRAQMRPANPDCGCEGCLAVQAYDDARGAR